MGISPRCVRLTCSTASCYACMHYICRISLRSLYCSRLRHIFLPSRYKRTQTKQKNRSPAPSRKNAECSSTLDEAGSKESLQTSRIFFAGRPVIPLTSNPISDDGRKRASLHSTREAKSILKCWRGEIDRKKKKEKLYFFTFTHSNKPRQGKGGNGFGAVRSSIDA